MNSYRNSNNHSQSQNNNGGHFKQFFNNSLTRNGQNQQSSINLGQNESIKQIEMNKKNNSINLESFSKHITTSPSMKSFQYSNDKNNHSIATTAINNNYSVNNNNNTNLSINNNNNNNSIQSQQGYQNKTPLQISTLNNSQINNNQNSLENSIVGSINISQSKNNNQSQSNNINSRTLQLQRSFFFNGPERFENEKNSNYYGQSIINPLVDTRKYDTSQINDITFSKIFEKKEQQYDQSKLHMKTENLISPQSRFKELNEVKENQKLLQEWKQDHQLKSKQLKLAKAAFKSGISHLDGPLSEDTQIYTNEHNSFIKKEIDEKKRRQVRLSYIEKFVTTNPAISFDNTISHSQFEQRKNSFPHQIDDFQNGFMRKHKSDLAASRNTQTFDRLFGHNLSDQKQIIGSTRSKFLMSKDLYGKTQNIISNTLNPSLKYAN